MLEKIVLGGRVLYVEPKTAEEARRRMGILTLRNQKLSRELAVAKVGPKSPGNQIQPINREIIPVAPVVLLDNRAEWLRSKRLNPAPVRTVEEKWQAFLARNRKAIA